MSESVDLVKNQALVEVSPPLERTSSCERALAKVALALFSPFDKSSESVIRAFVAEIKPGRFNNCYTVPLEITRRVGVVALSALFLPLTLSLALCSKGLSYATQKIFKKNFISLPGDLNPLKMELGSQSFTIASFNACLFDMGLPQVFGGLIADAERIERGIQLVRQANPDFLVMQEVSFKFSLPLYEGFKGDYATFYTRIAPHAWGMDSALFIASKYRFVKEPVFLPLSAQTGRSMGAFFFETDRAFFCMTHLMPAEGLERATIRQEQLESIKTKMRELKGDSLKPFFVVGDLNIDRNHDEARVLKGFFDPLKDQKPVTCTNSFTASFKGQTCTEADESIDYVLLEGEAQNQVEIEAEVMPAFGPSLKASSDHHLVLARCQLK